MGKDKLSKTQELAIQTRLSQLGAGIAIMALILVGIYIQGQGSHEGEETFDHFVGTIQQPEVLEGEKGEMSEEELSNILISDREEQVQVNQKQSQSLSARTSAVQFDRTWGEKVGESTFTVNWEVSQAINTHSYEVQRSLNGKDFIPLGTIAHKHITHEGSRQFAFTDKELLTSQLPKIYYRVVHMGTDGQSKISHRISHRLPLNTGLYSMVEEKEEQLHIFYASDETDSLWVEVLNERGKIQARKRVKSCVDASLIRVPKDNWPIGKYWVKLSSNNMSIRESVILEKQRQEEISVNP
ncbi:MAG: hypothetical protein AAFY71_16655 [Bacteroidota bacterium]